VAVAGAMPPNCMSRWKWIRAKKSCWRTIARRLPAISKQPGFVDVKLLKFRSVASGGVKPPASYRLLISFQTEEQRLQRVATDLHQKVWPTLSKTLKNPDAVAAILYDVA
jgi:hypothetical protein